MATTKKIISVVTEMLTKLSPFAWGITESTHFLKETLRAELLNIALKLFFGLILTSVIIFALISVGQQTNDFFLAQQNGAAISITFFSIIAIAGSGGLWFLLKSRLAQKETSTEQSMDVNLQLILTHFLQGVAEGLEKSGAKPSEAESPMGNSKIETPVDTAPESSPSFASSSLSSNITH